MGFADANGTEEKSRMPAALAAGAIVVLILLGILLLVTGRTQHPSHAAPVETLPFGAAEQAYSAHIHFQNIHLLHANNFLNQEFTYVAGTLANDGTQDILGLKVEVTFYDPFQQVILRDTEPLIGPASGPLPAGISTDFQITLDQALPATWNHENPAIRVTGLKLK